MNSIPSKAHRVTQPGFYGIAAAALVALAGCTLEPHYQRPVPPVAQQWPDGPAFKDSTADASNRTAPAAAAADIGWRDFFKDERLQKLIEIALANNPDAQVAALNVAAAQAQYRIQRADLFPSIAGTGIDQVERYPPGVFGTSAGGGVNSSGGGGTGTGTGSGGSGSGGITRFYNLGIGFTSYEIDLFGRIRSLDRQRLQQYFGYVETRRSAQISLVAQIANLYLTLLADQELLRITQDTVNSEQHSYDLTKLSFEGGVATALDLRQAETAVDTARANLALYTRQLAQTLDLFVLLGAPVPKDMPPGNGFDDQRLLAHLPAGLPSDLLTRRPDVLAAEHNLIAANANIGAARAAFFPSISLTGSYGTASNQLSGLFDHGSSAWTFSPQVNLPIFAGGANKASLDLAKIQKNVSIVQYEQTVETAFREVTDALAGRGTLDDEVAADQALVDATSESYTLADMRFRAGVDNYLAVLDAQRSLYTAQQTLVNVKLERLENLVSLYKALGGGWNEQTVRTADASLAAPATSTDKAAGSAPDATAAPSPPPQ